MTLASFLKKGQRQLVSYAVFLAMIVSITIVKKKRFIGEIALEQFLEKPFEGLINFCDKKASRG